LKNDKQGSFKYNRLFFTTQGKPQYLSGCFQYGDTDSYKDCSIGILLESEELMNVLKDVTGKIH